MKILILGSQGFIGSYLAAHFISHGHTITGVDLMEGGSGNYEYQKVSILSSDFDTLFSGLEFDVCINASGSGNVSYSMSHPLSDFEANTLAVVKVLDTIRKYRPACRYLHISSAAVYGNPVSLPISEEAELKPLSPYGFHKRISELVCQEYTQLYQLPIAIIRPFSVYGMGLRKQLLWDICQKLHQQDAISLFGTGNETRDFIHVTDLALLIGKIIESDQFNCAIFNGACGTETSIRQVADIFSMCHEGKKTISFSGQIRSGDPLNWRADVQRSSSIGFRPSVDLQEGIKAYVNWYESIVA